MASKNSKESAWTLEDMPRLAEEVEALGTKLQNVISFHDTYESRLIAAEKALLAFDAGERLLPSEVISGLSPGQIFQVALQAIIIGNIMANPMLFAGQTSEKVRSVNADRCLDAATTILNRACARMPGKEKKKAS